MKYFEHLTLLKNIKGLGIAKINKNYSGLVMSYPSFDDFREYLIDAGIATHSEAANASDKIEKIRSTLDKNAQLDIITCFDDEYPERFNLLENQRPVLFYIAGDGSILNNETIAVIGTRKPSVYGTNATKRIIGEINDAVIVSGLALGIDRNAHEAAIQNELKTMAVLPSGLGNIAPSSNKQLAEIIADGNGCLISEYDFDDKPEKYTFLRRDALVAAISDVIAVIECSEKSGTMHTVESAIKMKKPIACYYTDKGGDYSGNKKLLDSGSAVRIIRPDDINDVIDNNSHQMSIKEMMNQE